MKNSLSKTLLCGIMATSFILANCQKAPNRGVKAGAPGAGVTDQVDTTQKIVACTPDYLAAYTETSKQQAKMGVQLKSIEDSENVTEVMKADMSKEIEELARLIKISEPAAVKLEADGCKSSTKTIIFKDVFEISNGIGARVAKITGQESDLSKRATASLRLRAANALAEGMKLAAGKDLADALDESQKNGASYFVDGMRAQSDFKTVAAKTDKTVCYVTVTSGKVEAKSVLNVLKINEVTTDEASKRKLLSVNIISSAGPNVLECLLSDKGNDAKAELRKAFGRQLMEVIATTQVASADDSTAEATEAQKLGTRDKVTAPATSPAKVDPTDKPAVSDAGKVKIGDTKAAVQAAKDEKAAKDAKDEKAAADQKKSAAPVATEINKPDTSATSEVKIAEQTKAFKQAAVGVSVAASKDATKAEKTKVATEKPGFFGRAFNSVVDFFSGFSTENVTYDAMGNVTSF